MKPTLRTAAALLAAVTVSAAVAGCAGVDQEKLAKYCQSRPAACEQLNLPGTAPAAATGATRLARAAAPAPLADWAAAQTGAEPAASVRLTDADATYVAIAGGLQSTGGFRVEVTNVTQQGDNWLIDAKVVPPAPDVMVTMALANPVGIFKLPKLSGEITVNLTGPSGASTQLKAEPAAADTGATPGTDLSKPGAPVEAAARWAEGNMLNVSGRAQAPDLHLEVRKGSVVLGQADVQVKDGGFMGNILVEGGPAANLTLAVSTVAPGGGELLMTVAVPAPAGSSTQDELTSANFRISQPRQISADEILVEGTARVFEATFEVEVWVGSKQVAHQMVMTDDGAPAFGRFSAKVKVPGGVPARAMVKFVIESAKDGSRNAELIVPVLPLP